MGIATKEYQELVLDQIKLYGGLARPINTGLLKRLLVQRTRIEKVHPNPDDEFCYKDIGPNYGIVGDYEKVFRQNMHLDRRIGGERLCVARMSTGGYMLMNGHHRWLAAHRVNARYVPIQIINVMHEDEIIKRIRESKRDMCVSFDFDEVLTLSGKDKELCLPVRLMFKRTLRKNVGALIRELRALGFDVWVYSGAYHSEKFVNAFFKAYGTSIDGYISTTNHKKSNQRIRQAFRESYRLSVHVDNESVLWVDTGTHDYDSAEIRTEEHDWTVSVFNIIKDLDAVKQSSEGGK